MLTLIPNGLRHLFLLFPINKFKLAGMELVSKLFTRLLYDKYLAEQLLISLKIQKKHIDPLVKEVSRSSSTNQQNQTVYDQPFYIAIAFKPIMQFNKNLDLKLIFFLNNLLYNGRSWVSQLNCTLKL